MRLARLVRAGFMAAALGLCGPALAQDAAPAAPLQSPFLTIDPDRLFAESAWGKRLQSEVEADGASLAAENRRIEADLAAEEKSLTERRASMKPDEFRAEADAFDTRVTGIRAAQDAKSRDLTRKSDEGRQAFFEAVFPLLPEVLARHGALVIIDRRTIFVGAESIDVTDDLVRLADEKLGTGPAPTPEPPTAAPATPPAATPDPAAAPATGAN